ncbi:hypothetical protein ELS19_19805 [Halogeometricum borinquense]|uniref:DUF3267 domain-containing protein n=1 Tax=Halogeometricum borinquense TaxID=60847 RepID=A0A482T9Y3_9EURY|nr:hypothetical protein [Halogeometricum borinquense]RYJ07763.1 hypothetical protein ELS19_19805 [Halogeometricum borinquense]
MLGKTLGLVGLPVTVAHEATHAALLWPWIDDWAWSIEIDASRGAAFYCDLADDIPRWAVVLGHLGPTIVGTMIAAAVSIAWILTGFSDLPETVVGWAKLALALVAWGMYVAPSPDDLEVFSDG